METRPNQEVAWRTERTEDDLPRIVRSSDQRSDIAGTRGSLCENDERFRGGGIDSFEPFWAGLIVTSLSHSFVERGEMDVDWDARGVTVRDVVIDESKLRPLIWSKCN